MTSHTCAARPTSARSSPSVRNCSSARACGSQLLRSLLWKISATKCSANFPDLGSCSVTRQARQLASMNTRTGHGGNLSPMRFQTESPRSIRVASRSAERGYRGSGCLRLSLGTFIGSKRWAKGFIDLAACAQGVQWRLPRTVRSASRASALVARRICVSRVNGAPKTEEPHAHTDAAEWYDLNPVVSVVTSTMSATVSLGFGIKGLRASTSGGARPRSHPV